MKIKKIIILIIVIFFSLVTIKFFNGDYNISYTIKENDLKFKIKEQFTKKTDLNKLNYYFEITINKKTYPFQIYTTTKYKKRLIKKVYYYKDNEISCLYPVFNDLNQPIDMICLNEDEYIYYHEIKGENKNLDKYVEKIKEYNSDIYKDDIINKKNSISINKLDNKKFFLVENYKGLYIINNGKIKYNIQLFDKDVYTKPIKYLINEYFIIADYNQKYNFHKFYIVNIITGKIKEIETNYDISFDSYIQGSVDNNIYLFDKDNKKQYKIDYKNKQIKLVSDSVVKVYKNNKWESENIYKAIESDLKFINYNDDTLNINDNYIYKLDDNVVYRLNKQNNKYKFKILKTSNINKIYFYEDYIYYLENGYFYLIHDTFGKKTVLYNREFEFNDDLMVAFIINN